jgi:hypothetical protein
MPDPNQTTTQISSVASDDVYGWGIEGPHHPNGDRTGEGW